MVGCGGGGYDLLLVSRMALVVKTPPVSAGDAGVVGSFLALGRSPGGRHGNPLQYSCLENPVDRGVWWAAVHGSQRVGHK